MTGARIPPFLLQKGRHNIMANVERKMQGRLDFNKKNAIQLCEAMVVLSNAVYSGEPWEDIDVWKDKEDKGLRANVYIKIPVSGKENGDEHTVRISLHHTLHDGITLSAMAGFYLKYKKSEFKDLKALKAGAPEAGKELVAWVDSIIADLGQTRIMIKQENTK
ncbi:MAG: hypothetical protein K0U41_09000 [Gammaproteobacteria bacterium]|nr:hypothetical protein [Gammaproteobacteria bacterium]